MWAEWNESVPCSKTCGGGQKKMKREVTTPAKHGGKCEGGPTKDEDCNEQPCPGTFFSSIDVDIRLCSYHGGRRIAV